MKNICYIIGAGELAKEALTFSPDIYDFVIAADGGYSHLKNAGIRIDLLIGDFDSLEEKPEFHNTVRLNTEKNETDLYAAIMAGLEKGCKTFCIYGGLGGSMRHTLANIQCLKMLALKQCRGYLIGENEVLTVIRNESVGFSEKHKGMISVFSLDPVSNGVTLKNLKYPLNSYTMSDIFSIGVSNEFINKPATVSVTDGTLLLVYDFDEECYIINHAEPV